MTKKESNQITTGSRVEFNAKAPIEGTGTITGVAAGPVGYWMIETDEGPKYRIGYRMIDFI